MSRDIVFPIPGHPIDEEFVRQLGDVYVFEICYPGNSNVYVYVYALC